MERNNILVLAEHDNLELKAATGKTVSAARQLPGEITLLIVGSPAATVLQAASRLPGVRQIWLDDSSCYQDFLAENVATLVAELGKDFAYILAPASTHGKNILPRVAALLGVAQISEVIKIISPNTYQRPTYAGNVLETVQSVDPIQVLTVRTTAFSAFPLSATEVAIEKIAKPFDLKLSQRVSQETPRRERPELTSARIVVSGGRGLQSKEKFKLIEEIADQLGAAIGASRAAVDAGFISNEYQVGQTGKVVAPELYLAVGISGAIQHVAGMKDSKIIVAINCDPNAPIFEIADYRFVGDLFQILPALQQELAIRLDKA